MFQIKGIRGGGGDLYLETVLNPVLAKSKIEKNNF